ncbi:ArsR/SmtB family transcription factor [Woeseia oceani]|nr:metalloregulator ArsR/SmtB family transcription factor [Woeseia oceani]
MKKKRLDGAALRQHADEASRLLKTIGNPIRLMILCTLVEGEYAVGELNERIAQSQSTLSQHLAILRREGIVQTRREAQTIYYSLNSTEVRSLMEWLYKTYCR